MDDGRKTPPTEENPPIANPEPPKILRSGSLTGKLQTPLFPPREALLADGWGREKHTGPAEPPITLGKPVENAYLPSAASKSAARSIVPA